MGMIQLVRHAAKRDAHDQTSLNVLQTLQKLALVFLSKNKRLKLARGSNLEFAWVASAARGGCLWESMQGNRRKANREVNQLETALVHRDGVSCQGIEDTFQDGKGNCERRVN